MKLSKIARWVLTIGILAILLISLGVAYSRQKAAQTALSADIVQAQQNFDKYSAQKKELEPKLSQANSRIADAQSKFRKPSESIEINTALFEAAKDANVTLTRLSSSAPKEEKLGGITLQVFSITISAEGEVVPALLNFSNRISEKFPTATIGTVSIGVTEAKPSITLNLKIYAYESK